MFDQIEKLKREYTDKYVKVNASVPELARFGDYVGQVKTVNMSGRALVQFDAWNNIGWYDIDPTFLTVVPKPEATANVSEPAAKPAAGGEKKMSPLEMARAQGAAKGGAAKPAGEKPAATTKKPAAPAAKKSTADILAAARAGKSAAAPAAQPETATAAKPATSPATKPGGKMSTAEILAAARATKDVEGPAAAAAETKPAPTPAAAPAAKTAPAGEKQLSNKPAFPPDQRPSVPEILAWCRAHDSK